LNTFKFTPVQLHNLFFLWQHGQLITVFSVDPLKTQIGTNQRKDLPQKRVLRETLWKKIIHILH